MLFSSARNLKPESLSESISLRGENKNSPNGMNGQISGVSDIRLRPRLLRHSEATPSCFEERLMFSGLEIIFHAAKGHARSLALISESSLVMFERPGTGSEKEKGKYNNILNIPLPAGTSSEEYLNAYEHVLKKLKQFKPEFVLFSAGFDAHKDDPLAQLHLKSKDFYDLTKRTLEVVKLSCKGNIVSILEGGYDLKALLESTEMHINALLEDKN